MQLISRKEAILLKKLRYFTGKPCHRGHVAERRVSNHACLVCHKENQSALLKSSDEFRKSQNDATRRWRQSPSGRIISSDYNKKYRAENPKDKENERTRLRDLQRRKRKSCNHYRIKMALSRRISTAIKKNRRQTSEILINDLGYTLSDLFSHLEKQFLKGMTWENYGKYGWHIDHIVPFSSFDFSDPSQFNQCWSLANLRPLWASDNMKKSHKRIFLI